MEILYNIIILNREREKIYVDVKREKERERAHMYDDYYLNS